MEVAFTPGTLVFYGPATLVLGSAAGVAFSPIDTVETLTLRR